MISFLEYNTQSVQRNLSFLDFYLNSNKIDFCILSEVFLKDENCFEIKVSNYALATKCRNDGYGGVSILVKKGVNFRRIPYNSAVDIIIIKTINLKPNLFIASCYFPPSLDVQTFRDEIQSLCDFLDGEQNVILAGDFNARHRLYDDQVSTDKGKILVNAISSSSFCVLNNGNTTFHCKRSGQTASSVLDLTFSNSTILSFNWNTSTVSIGKSQHSPILFHSRKNSVKKIENFISRNFLMDRLSKVDLPSDLSSIQSAFQSVIMSARTNFPDIGSFSPKPWWNPSLSTLFPKYQAARKKMSKYANPANYIEYMKILKEWRSAVRKAKRAHRGIAIKDLCGNGNPRSFWNYINGHRHSNRKLSGCAVWNDRDNKKYLDMLKSYIPIVNPITMPSIPFSSISNTPFSLHELMYVLHFRKRATAAGCDGVKYDMLTALSGGSVNMLLHAINNCWSTNCIPSDLRCIKIVPIPKPVHTL
ncbi:uncharacterized protein ACN427_013804 isoform 2-T2 [Glossina fuscipes fuscipes]